jgi:hypothetical protein
MMFPHSLNYEEAVWTWPLSNTNPVADESKTNLQYFKKCFIVKKTSMNKIYRAFRTYSENIKLPTWCTNKLREGNKSSFSFTATCMSSRSWIGRHGLNWSGSGEGTDGGRLGFHCFMNGEFLDWRPVGFFRKEQLALNGYKNSCDNVHTFRIKKPKLCWPQREKQTTFGEILLQLSAEYFKLSQPRCVNIHWIA